MSIHAFWMNVYIAAIRVGNSSGNANIMANDALRNFKALDVDAIQPYK